MIFGIGLPRAAGQTLAAALQILHNGKTVYHSVEGHRWDVLHDHHVGAVEVYAPYEWLNRLWPDSLYIVNWRDGKDWIKSCKRVYEKSQQQGWNHPLWTYPPESWMDYSLDYHDLVQQNVPEHRLLWWNIINDPTWDSLCDFLNMPIPDAPFPNQDRHGTRGAVIEYTFIDEEFSWPSPFDE